jgi:hypothetical protein
MNYPRIISNDKKENLAICDCCKEKATNWLRIAYSCMRGEDEVYSVCNRHLKIANEDLHKFHLHYKTKEKFINDKLLAI